MNDLVVNTLRGLLGAAAGALARKLNGVSEQPGTSLARRSDAQLVPFSDRRSRNDRIALDRPPQTLYAPPVAPPVYYAPPPPPAPPSKRRKKITVTERVTYWRS